jgi:hypothetical protein
MCRNAVKVAKMFLVHRAEYEVFPATAYLKFLNAWYVHGMYLKNETNVQWT